MIKCNMGKVDRIVRIIIGLVILAIGIAFRSWWGVVGIFLLLTAVIRWCPAYLPFGISTCENKDA